VTLGEGEDGVQYAMTLNMHRRHLSEGQREVIGAKALEVEKKLGIERMRAGGRGRDARGPPRGA